MKKHNKVKSQTRQFVNNSTYLSSKPDGFKVIRVVCLAVTLLVAFGCTSTRESHKNDQKKGTWEEVKRDKNDLPSWIIYSRGIPGTNFLAYKIEGEIQSTSKACLSWFKKDIHNLAEDLENKKFPVYEIVHETADTIETYVIHNEPFPLKDTEMSVRYVFSSDDDGEERVKWREAWNDQSIAPSKKLSRVETFRGQWVFTDNEGGTCKAQNKVSFDPKKMPMWLIEPMVFKFLKHGLRDLRASTKANNGDF